MMKIKIKIERNWCVRKKYLQFHKNLQIIRKKRAEDNIKLIKYESTKDFQMFYLFTIITNKSCGPNYIYIIILSLCLNFITHVYLFNVIILNIIIVIYTVFRHKTCHNKLS